MEAIILQKTILTGNYYFKPTYLGLILYVEKQYEYSDNTKYLHFHKATIEDAFALNLIQSNKLITQNAVSS